MLVNSVNCRITVKISDVTNYVSHPQGHKSPNQTEGALSTAVNLVIADRHFNFPQGLPWVCIS